MRKTLLVAILCALQVSHLLGDFSPCTSLPSESSLKILQTLNGKVRGECKIVPVSYFNTSKISTDVFSWLSVPYAEAPINQNRFKRPIPVRNWTGIIHGTSMPNSCMQNAPGHGPISEDCLYLNVFARSDTFLNKNTALSPILVFIHGGSLLYGGSSQPLINLSTIVAMSGIIVVTINYRLDAFGFLRLEGTEATGNQGLFDQNMALKWVHDNAASFGGDSSKVTINGESAGAWSVGNHLLYAGSWPYFRNAIMHSGGPTTSIYFL